MAIDYSIGLDCLPKQKLPGAALQERLKERARAEEIIRWFREAGDERPPAQMGFEFSRSSPSQPGQKQVLVVQDLLDSSAVLDSYAPHCRGCQVNRYRAAYGCTGFIHYPISAQAEQWLLERLPVPDEPLTWLLLRQGIQRFGYDGASLQALRAGTENRFFELPVAPQRRLGELQISADQALEMILGVGERIAPNHAGILLLFFHAIERDLEAVQIQRIASFDSSERAQFPFLLEAHPSYDACTREFVDFFHALYIAWQQNLPLLIDA